MKEILLAQAEPRGIYNPALSEIIGRGEGIDIINLLLGNIISLLLIVGVVIALVFIIMGAIQWMTAGSDKEKITSARGKVISAVIGLVVLFAVFAIMKIVGVFFGIEALENLLFDLSPYLIN